MADQEKDQKIEKATHPIFSLEFFHIYTDPIEAFIRFIYLLVSWFLCFRETYEGSNNNALYLLGLSCCMFIFPIIIDLVYAILRQPRVFFLNGIFMSVYLVFMIWIINVAIPMVLRKNVGDFIINIGDKELLNINTLALLKKQTMAVWIINLIDSIVMIVLDDSNADDKIMTSTTSKRRLEKFAQGLSGEGLPGNEEEKE